MFKKKRYLYLFVFLFVFITFITYGAVYILDGSVMSNGRTDLKQQVDYVSEFQNYRIGTRLQINAKTYRYAKIGANTGDGLDIEAGLGVVSLDTITYIPSPSSATTTDLKIAGGDSAGRVLYVTIPNCDENNFQYGTLMLIDSSQGSKMWSTTISSNDSNIIGTDSILITLEDDLPVAVIPTDTVLIFPSPYNNVAPGADSMFSTVVGICNFYNGHAGSLTDYEGYYGWIQTWGPCAIKLHPSALSGGHERERGIYNYGGGFFGGLDSLGLGPAYGLTGSGVYRDSSISEQPSQIIGNFLARNEEGTDFLDITIIDLKISP